MTSPYWGKWTEYHCGISSYNGICQFYPKGTPKVVKPTLPNRGGCKSGWWAFGGYCYKEFGLRVDDNGAMDSSQGCKNNANISIFHFVYIEYFGAKLPHFKHTKSH